MALNQKISPVNEDVVIANIQGYLYNDLLANGFTKYESYERIYVNDGSPELYLKNGHYKEVYYDDRHFLTSFFILGDNKAVDEFDNVTVDVSVIFQANLKKLYPSITHRADAEFQRQVQSVFENMPVGFKIKDIQTGIANVYSGLTFKNTQFLDDISSSHLVKFTLEIEYTNDGSCFDTVSFSCDPATITDSDGVSTFQVGSGGIGACTLIAPCLDATIIDSDGITPFNVISGGNGACTVCIPTTFNMIVNQNGTEIYNQVWDSASTNIINLN